jgi:hypothetical protein
MNKQTAINLLGGTPSLAAKAMGYKSSHAIYMWPETLSKPVADRVRGVCNLNASPLTRKSRIKNPNGEKHMGLTT